jgi:type II secretory pathway pseudopilin PulG
MPLTDRLLVLDWQRDAAVVVALALLVTGFYCAGSACVTAGGRWRRVAAASVVFLLVAALAWVVMVTSAPPPGRRHATRVRLEQIKTALQAYRLTYGHYPEGDEPAVTAALTARAASAANPRGLRFLWIEGYRQMPELDGAGSYLDAWQRPIRLEWTGGRESVILRSVGKDGIANTGDDVTVEIGGHGEPEPGGGG